MNDDWPGNVTRTFQIGSQRGPAYIEHANSFDNVVNGFLDLGWRILACYVEGKGSESPREECVCLMGWVGDNNPEFPHPYGEADDGDVGHDEGE